MTNFLYIRKTMAGDLSPKRINKVDFIGLIESDKEFTWLENSSGQVNYQVKNEKRSIALWNANGQSIPVWFILNEPGIIEVAMKSGQDTGKVELKAIEMATKLKAYVENEEGQILFDPASIK
ncbi:MAG: hypothetical protein J7578_03395 [Chitinophagaceae bacterium]|nr:hypothetical protein [Chitinophagaceae bacterium]